MKNSIELPQKAKHRATIWSSNSTSGHVLCSVAQSCDLMDCSLPGSSVHGDSTGKNTGVVTITLYARQQKRHRCIEQSFGLWEKARVGWFERIALKHVYYHMWNRLPVRCMRQGAQGWCTGMIQRDGMGREVGGGSGRGTHVHPWLIHVNVWQNHYNTVK